MASDAALGLSNLVEGQPAAAWDAFRKSATIARDRRVVRALLPLVMAGLAEVQAATARHYERASIAFSGHAGYSAGNEKRFREARWFRLRSLDT